MKFTVIASRLALAAVLLANSGQAWAAVAAPADAAPVDAAPGAASGGEDGAQSGSTFHDKKDEEIVVTAALPQSRQDVLSGVAVLKAEELTAALRPSIGDTLQHTAGASATSFGPSASRPVLRGLQGERVRVLKIGRAHV